MINAGEVNGDTLVWKKGMANWTAAESVGELGDAFASAPPPLPAASTNDEEYDDDEYEEDDYEEEEFGINYLKESGTRRLYVSITGRGKI
jgi:hypothetical protein